MKKLIPYISPVIIGMLSGWFVQCLLCFFSIMISPFAGSEETQFLAFCGISSLLSALLIIIVAIVNVVFLINLNNKKNQVFILVAQTCIVIFLFVFSWSFANPIVNALYKLF